LSKINAVEKYNVMKQFPGGTIVINDLSGALFLQTKSIVRIEAMSSYSTLLLEDGKKITVSKVLKHFENMLGQHGFARIHRSHLINSAWIQRYHTGRGEISMKNNDRITVSRRKRRTIKNDFIKPFSVTN
jgi:two-component system LytT family response regulator